MAATARRALFGLAAAGLVVALLAVLLVAGEWLARREQLAPLPARLREEAWARPDPMLGWVPRAGVFHAEESGRAAMTFLPGGRRATRARPDPPPDARVEVVLVGGSWTAGYGVRDDETFGWLLGEALPEVRVENLGAGGYGTLQSGMRAELAYAQRRIAPDVVVYGFATFHAMRNVDTAAWARGLWSTTGQRLAPPRAELVAAPPADAGGDASGAGERLVVHPPQTLPAWPLERHFALVRVLHARWLEFAWRERERQAPAVTQRLLRRFASSVRRMGAEPVVMVLFGDDELRPYLQELHDGGVATLDCRFPDDPKSAALRVGGTGHPNATVHRYWADCLRRHLKHRVLPRFAPGAPPDRRPTGAPR